MSIQDDIFDVIAALEGKPEESALERVLGYLSSLESRQERDAKKLIEIENAALVFKQLFNQVE